MEFKVGIIIIVGVIGIIFITMSISKEYYKQEEYKDVNITGVTLDEKLKMMDKMVPPLKELYNDMFNKSSPWFGSFNIYDINRRII